MARRGFVGRGQMRDRHMPALEQGCQAGLRWPRGKGCRAGRLRLPGPRPEWNNNLWQLPRRKSAIRIEKAFSSDCYDAGWWNSGSLAVEIGEAWETAARLWGEKHPPGGPEMCG